MHNRPIIGIVVNGRKGVDILPQRRFYKQSPINKRKMVPEEIHHFKGFSRITTVVRQVKQGAWIKWKIAKDIADIWSDHKHMEQKKFSFLIKAVYTISSTYVNQYTKKITISDRDRTCGKNASLKNVLTDAINKSKKSLKHIVNRVIDFDKEGNDS